MKTPTFPTLIDPTLNDLALTPIIGKLESLDWLKCFGEAQRINDIRDKRNYYHPAIFYGGQTKKEYFSVFPDSHILIDLSKGGFCFFDPDGMKVTPYAGSSSFEISFGIVVWFDYRKVYPTEWRERTINNVINDVMAELNKTSIRVVAVEKKVEKIYPGYTITEIKNQFLMRPFGGFRINASLKYNQKCS